MGLAVGGDWEIPREVKGFDEVEVIVIDDGSAVDTSRVARDAGADLAVRHRRNRSPTRAGRSRMFALSRTAFCASHAYFVRGDSLLLSRG